MTEVNRVMIENAPDDIRDLLAEVEWLRGALESIAGIPSYWEATIARKALEG